MYNNTGNPIVTECVFSNNSANVAGGAIRNRYSSNPTVTNCLFSGNSAGAGGGGMHNNSDCNPVVTGCLFNGNTANNGGGMINNANSNPTVTQCTFSGNSALVDGGGMHISSSTPALTNCIFWDNTDAGGKNESAQVFGSGAVINYSCIQGLTGALGGVGNIGNNPMFVDADGPDNLLVTTDDNLRLLAGSPCIDAGDSNSVPAGVTTDLDGLPRIVNGVVDMGAYEGGKQGFLLSASSIVVNEGGTADFTVALAKDPLGSVEVTAAYESGDSDISVFSGATLYFDSSNYSVPLAVTLAAASDDDYFHGTALIWISADGFFTAVVTATELDSDVPVVVYVDPNAPGADDGTSWADAFRNLQDALSLAIVYPQIGQIRVAQGIYKPTEPSGGRNATFQLKNSVTI
jgi:hypothetical protein